MAESCRNHDLTDSMIIGTLYLITEHTSFYERYGWKYLCMVQCDDGEQMRMYIYHSTSVLRGARIKEGEGAEGEASRLYLTDNRMEKELNY